MKSVFGPDTVRFANLEPVNAGADIRTFKNLASGQLLPGQFTHVKQTGTTATNMIALKG